MGKQQNETGSKTKQPDRLAKVLQAKQCVIDVDDRSLTVVKWNLKTSCLMMTRLGGILEKVVAGVGDVFDVSAFLRQDLSKLIEQHYDDIVDVLAHTVQRSNFENLQEAKGWVEELGLADAVQLFSVIVEQNLRPLVEAARSIGDKLRKVADDKARKALQP